MKHMVECFEEGCDGHFWVLAYDLYSEEGAPTIGDSHVRSGIGLEVEGFKHVCLRCGHIGGEAWDKEVRQIQGRDPEPSRLPPDFKRNDEDKK